MNNMTIHARIEILRKSLHLNQAAFGERIGLRGGAIGKMERGGTVTDQNIKLICEKFHIRRDWLVDGEGEMAMAEDDDSIIAQLVEEYRLTPSQTAIIRSFLSLDDVQREAIAYAIINAAQEIEKAHKEETQKEQERRNEAHRLLDMELDAEEKGLSVSTSGSSGMGAEKEA